MSKDTRISNTPNLELEPDDYALIRAVVDSDTLPDAARKLHISLPSLKRRLYRLRVELGCPTNRQLAYNAGRYGLSGVATDPDETITSTQGSTISQFDIVPLNDHRWNLILRRVPEFRLQATAGTNYRSLLNGVLYPMSTGCNWADIPPEYGDDSTCHRILGVWVETGIWQNVWMALFSTLSDMERHYWASTALKHCWIPVPKRRRRKQFSK